MIIASRTSHLRSQVREEASAKSARLLALNVRDASRKEMFLAELLLARLFEPVVATARAFCSFNVVAELVEIVWQLGVIAQDCDAGRTVRRVHFPRNNWKEAMGYKVAVIGATGNVGREMLNVLAEREFPADKVYAVASRRSLGVEVSYGEKTLKCQDLEQFDFSGIDFALMSAGGAVSLEWTPKIAATGCLVIDNSSAWRYDQDVPLIVPEVNAAALVAHMARPNRKNIIANPNCSTAQMVLVLKPLHDENRIKRIVVSTYQSVSGAGKEAMDELWHQTKGTYVPGTELAPNKFPKQIAFNVIPQIDVFMEDGYTKEEWKMLVETKKILDPGIKLTATCVRVPVFVGHAESINIEFERPMTVAEARAILREAPGVMVVDKREPGGYVTPVDCAGEFATYVSRIREDTTIESGLSMWVVSDNLLKGAALNTVQIAETIVSRKLLESRAA